MKHRVVVIGLDSAPLDLLQKWVNAGELPHIGQIMQAGATGILESTFPPLSPAAWSSFATGMFPGKHGVFDHAYRQPGTYVMVPSNARRRAGRPLWQLIGDYQGRVGVINVPETYPPEPVNGFMITGMTTPSDEAEWCYPPSLAQELQKAIGGYKVFGRRSKEDLDISLAGMHENIPQRIRAAAYLWQTYAPAFMILVFMETDLVQHETWKYMDRSHPDHDPHLANKYGGAILNVYKRIDEHLPLLLDRVDEDTAVIIMSDHGAGPIEQWLNINVWLWREGLMQFKPDVTTRFRRALFTLGFTPQNALRVARKLRLGMLDRAAERAKKEASLDAASSVTNLFLSFKDVDWTQTKAYTLGGNLTGIWVNLSGREPQGCVIPGADYERVRDELIARLQDMRDTRSGELVVEAAYRREELYTGPYVERAPDVVFKTRNEKYVDFGLQDFFTNQMMAPSPLFSGHHRQAGMVSLYGPPFKTETALETQRIVDLAPTILHILGYPVPNDMDGQVMSAALSDDFRRRHPVLQGPAVWKPAPDDGSHYSDADEATVTRRLQELGYL